MFFLKKGFFFFILCLSSLYLHAQESFYTPDGKERLLFSTEKILIEFEAGIGTELQKEVLSNFSELAPFNAEMLTPQPFSAAIVPLNNIRSENIPFLVAKLKREKHIKYAGAFLQHPDGTLLGITRKLIVGIKQQTDRNLLYDLVRKLGGMTIKFNEFDPLMFHVELEPGHPSNGLQIANKIFETGLVAYAEPDFLRIMKKLSTNDPLNSNQWALNNDGTNTSTWGGIAGSDMSVFNAWATTTGSSSIKVAILDEGVDLIHPDLQANLEPGYDATGNGSAGGPSGDDAHGTACAGIVAAVGNNNLGMAGVAYGCRIIPVRIAFSSGSSWITSNTIIANAINWAWQTGGADVLSNSWGGGSSSSAINSAIDAAIANGRGGLGSPVLFAAGNSNGSVIYPGSYAPTIAVIAMSMCDQRKSPSSCDGETWWGSCYGTNADVAAPGVKIVATDISGTAGYNAGDYTTTFNGTSSACPNAAGVMALILSQAPLLTEQEARFTLESSCDKVGGYTYLSGQTGQPNGTWSTNLGYGRVNAEAALSLLQAPLNDDAGIRNISSPTGSICQEKIQPQIQLMNYGSNPLDSVTINYQLNAGSVQSILWDGPLASGAYTNVTLPEISLTGGNQTLTIFTSNPNGQTDNKMSNDTAQTTFFVGTIDLTLTLTLDNYPSETSWVIRDSTTGNILASGNNYQNSNTTVVENFCLNAGCYEFVIYDSYGDGICCNYGNGSFLLQNDETGQTIAEGGNFGSSDTTAFCLTAPQLSADDAGITSIIGPLGLVCETSDTPSVTLKNFGTDTLTSVIINYSLNNGTPSNYSWTGNLQPSATTEVTLPPISLVNYSNTLKVYTSLPNGNVDGRTSNDTIADNFNYADIDISLHITLDLYPGETSWEIRDTGGNRIIQGGNYKVSGETIIEDFCLTAGCYDFYIFDAYGDGMCCNFGNGAYALINPLTGDTLASGGSFTYTEVTNFCYFQSPEPNNCPDSLLLADMALTDSLYQAGIFLSSSGVVSATDSVTLQAGSKIVLLPGFQAEPGSNLTLRIASCINQNLLKAALNQASSNYANLMQKTPSFDVPSLKTFPNPFHHTTTLEYYLPENSENCSLIISDLNGKVITSILQGQSLTKGLYQEKLSINLPPGIYIATLQAGKHRVVRKLVSF